MKHVKSIAILGGGTSAWLAAAFLLNNLPQLKITVIDKEVGSPVGVGEGTILNFKPFMDNCGFNPDEWFSKIDATYKAGILFPNWIKEGKDIWHPFIFSDDYVWNAWSDSQDEDFKRICLSLYGSVVEHNSIDKFIENMAYHVDCSKLVNFIKEKITNNIQFIQSEMVDFKEVNGNIESLTLKDDQVITADIFIDCTGFRGLLNTKPQRVSCEGRLICDTAIAGHIPYQDRDTELNPYVRSEAVDHGWIWNIPVRTRIGSGLVFNRSITDVEEAKDYFVNYWDNRVQKENLKVIDWTPFYNKNNWHGNVVSIGLSAGFIEPLESTGIALIMEGICQLRVNISNYTYDSMAVEMYNSTMVRFFEECIDFVSAHYTVTERDSKFWNIVKETIKPSDRQKMFMSLLQNPNFIMPQGRTPFSFFASANWMGWLIQQGFPVAPRNTPYPKEIIDEYYKVNEKHRHVWSRKHSDEIKRLEDLYNL